MESRQRAEAAGRAAAGKSNQGGSQRTYRGLPQTPPGGGVPSQTEETGYGAPVRYGPFGVKTALPEKAVPGKPAQSWSSWKDQVDKYNQAAKQWNSDHIKNNIINFGLPFGFKNV